VAVQSNRKIPEIVASSIPHPSLPDQRSKIYGIAESNPRSKVAISKVKKTESLSPLASACWQFHSEALLACWQLQSEASSPISKSKRNFPKFRRNILIHPNRKRLFFFSPLFSKSYSTLSEVLVWIFLRSSENRVKFANMCPHIGPPIVCFTP